MDINLKGKVAVITGGTAGIGFATAELFAREGAQVAVCSRSQSNVDGAVRELGRKGLEIHGKPVDVSSRKDLFAFADEVERKFGGIDIWMSNAGIMIEKKIIDTSEEEWRRTLGINLDSVYYGGLIAADKLRSAAAAS